jgi:hypothetical protein
MAAIVVQFGFATMPFGIDRSASGLTSETTSGTSGSLRHADELSITIAPAAAATGASAREVDPPAEKNTMSSPEKSAVAASSTMTSTPCQGSLRPAQRADANSRSDSTGSARSSRQRRIRSPTRPVAPTMPTRSARRRESGEMNGELACMVTSVGWGTVCVPSTGCRTCSEEVFPCARPTIRQTGHDVPL